MPAATLRSGPPAVEFIAAGQFDGLAAGLRRILDHRLPVPCSAEGRTLVPAGAVAGVAGWLVAGRVLAADRVNVRVLPHPLAATEELRLVRVTANPAAGPHPDPAGAGPDDGPLVSSLLAGVRLGLTGRMLDLAVAHLGTRLVDGQPLAHKQLPQGTIADAAAALELCRHRLATATSPASVEALHTRLSAVGWWITTLFGASGYLRSHPVRCLYLAHLVHDAWGTPVSGGWLAP